MRKTQKMIISAVMAAGLIFGGALTAAAQEPVTEEFGMEEISTEDIGTEEAMQIASAWVENGDGIARSHVTVDLRGGWSVEFAGGAFYLYEDMESGEDECDAMGISLTEDVYEEYVAEANESSSMRELGGILAYEDEYDGSTVYLFSVGNGGYFMLSVVQDQDADAVLGRIRIDPEEYEYGGTGESALYTDEELDEAVSKILDEFKSWGCTLNEVHYAGDECVTEENLAWANQKNDNGDYTDVVEFLMSFRSPTEEEMGGTAWEPDTDYNDYQWWLARTEGGEWEVISWGY